MEGEQPARRYSVAVTTAIALVFFNGGTQINGGT
jgi:hypothetical protein